jgi:hypothetical protein
LPLGFDSLVFAYRTGDVVAIHSADGFDWNQLWANGDALPDIRALAELFKVHLGHHVDGSKIPFRLPLRQQTEMRNLGSGK